MNLIFIRIKVRPHFDVMPFLAAVRMLKTRWRTMTR